MKKSSIQQEEVLIRTLSEFRTNKTMKTLKMKNNQVHIIAVCILLIIFSLTVTAQAQWINGSNQNIEARKNLWQQIGNNIYGGNEYEYSGSSLGFSSDGNTVAIGAPNPTSGPIFPGFVRVYHLSNDQWSQLGNTIQGEGIGDRFGYSVSLSDDASILAVGAPINFMGASKPGYVKVYLNNNGEWVQLGQTIHGETVTEHFGYVISLSSDGTVLAIGSSEVNASKYSSVKVFQFIAGNWELKGNTLFGSDPNDSFGQTVALNADGNILIVGVPKSSANGYLTGQVKVFGFEDGVWSQIGAGIMGDNESDSFGQAVSINAIGDVVAAGSTNANGFRGHVKVFQLSSSNIWEQIGNTISGLNIDDQTGAHISLNDLGDIIAIGAPVSSNFYEYDGRTNIYKLDNNQWLAIGDVIYGIEVFEFCGGRVALNSTGTKLAVSCYGAQYAMGKVSVFGYSGTVGVSETPSNEIKAFPNPARDYIYILPGSSDNLIVDILNLNGTKFVSQLIFDSIGNTPIKIDLGDLPAGLYILRVQHSKSNSYVKFFKQ